MTLHLYKTTSDPNVLNKDLQQINSVQGTLKDDTGVINPSFKLTKNVVGVESVNYLHWEDTDRYYFCKPIYEVGGMCTLVCSVDLLMTYKSQLLQLDAVVLRSENKRNAYLVDSEITVQNRTRYRNFKFPLGLTTDTMYLITI